MKTNIKRKERAKQRRKTEAIYWDHNATNDKAIAALTAKCKNWRKRYSDKDPVTVTLLKAKRAHQESTQPAA